ncbi:O-antigen ligase family protein [Microbacterium halotolerans]|uniref:O-antigen ligase family protein n=1 Tax=Microbacterium halotolerans TaxID=246613 RepID=UPI000E6AD7B8|nr:O-antigen ligase family protein [Microbacterium halotolerans]
MAQLTRHQIAPVPTAPAREATGRIALRALTVLLFFSAFAHTALWNLFNVGSLTVLAVLGLATLAVWIPLIARPERPDGSDQRVHVAPLAWRRLPWATLAYIVLAGASIAWSQWPGASAQTWGLLIGTTVPALFVAHVLTWSELLRTIELALKWVVGLSVLFELWAALIVRGPVAPNFIEMPEDPDPQIYWTRGDLFDLDARVQGIVGNANVLSIVCLIAIILVAVRLAARQRHRPLQAAWLVVAAALYLRADSATGHVAFAVAVAVAVAALLMRRITTRTGRTRLYALVFGATAAAIIAVVLLWDRVTDILGRSDGLSGRDDIWADVIERASAHPVFGNGFATPWVPWDDAFRGWIVDHDLTVFHAHNMWIDVFLQLGFVGVAVALVVFAAAAWRAWFFAVDRPRWDLEANRPYTALSLAPLLIMAVLLTQGLTESGPLMLWGWMLMVSLTFRIKLAPVVGIGAAESPRGVPSYASPTVLGTAPR